MEAVYIIDDNPQLREALASDLSAEGLRCETFASMETFFAAHPTEPEGCVVVDYGLPGINGLALQERLNAMGWQIPRLFLTGPTDVEAVLVALRGETTTLIQKPYRAASIQAAIRESLEINRQQQRAKAARQATQHRIDSLTNSERKVLRHLIDGQQNKAIAHRLDMGLRTVVRHRINALRKLGTESIPKAVQLLFSHTDGKPIESILSPKQSPRASRRQSAVDSSDRELPSAETPPEEQSA